MLFSGLPPEHRAEPHFDLAGDHKVAQVVANKPKPQTVAKAHIPVWPVSICPLNATPAHLSPPLIEGNRHRALLWAGRPRGHLSAKPCDYDTSSILVGLAAAELLVNSASQAQNRLERSGMFRGPMIGLETWNRG